MHLTGKPRGVLHCIIGLFCRVESLIFYGEEVYMNQDQIVENLIKLDDTVEDFTVTFSGKASKKVDGLYKPEGHEILIHNKNHASDNALMYTAIHEFAHHIQFTTSPKPVSSKSHTTFYWNILHRLLNKAEELGIYKNIFETEAEFVKLTKEIKEKYLHENGKLMKDFGQLIARAYELCMEYHTSFDDYMDRVLGLHRATAKKIMKFHTQDLNPEIGYENMKTVAAISDDDVRGLAQEAFLEGQSPDMVKEQFTSRELPDSRLEWLQQERERLAQSLEKLTIKLASVEQQINDFS